MPSFGTGLLKILSHGLVIPSCWFSHCQLFSRFLTYCKPKPRFNNHWFLDFLYTCLPSPHALILVETVPHFPSSVSSLPLWAVEQGRRWMRLDRTFSWSSDVTWSLSMDRCMMLGTVRTHFFRRPSSPSPCAPNSLHLDWKNSVHIIKTDALQS